MANKSIIAVWHGSVNDAVRFANNQGHDGLVSLIPDSEMRHALWGFYRVDKAQRDFITEIPRLTYKDGE
jgi:hypothetical protein